MTNKAKWVEDQPVFDDLEPRLLLATWYVDSAAFPGGDGSPLFPFDTIQQAIDFAFPLDSIEVAPGAYAENLMVHQPVTILPTTGNGATAILLGAGVGIDITADNVVFGSGVYGTVGNRGFNLIPDVATTTFSIQLTGNPTNVTIAGNAVDTVGAASRGLSTDQATNLTVSGNRFQFDDTNEDVAIDFRPESTSAVSANVTITGNTFTAASGTAHRAMTFGNVSNLDVLGNQIQSTIALQIGDTNASDDVEISGNTFTAGVVAFFRDGAAASQPLTNVNIHDNDFNDADGVLLYADSADVDASLQSENLTDTILLNENYFHDYAVGEEVLRVGYAGTPDLSGVVVDATLNYWSSGNGPNVPDNTYNVAGQVASFGNLAGAAIAYDPWWREIAGPRGRSSGSPARPIGPSEIRPWPWTPTAISASCGKRATMTAA